MARPAAALEEESYNFRGIRSAGMGGLLTTTGNYGEALFGNPARHSAVDTWKLAFFDLTAEVNSTLVSTASKLSSIKGSSGSGTISSAATIIGKNEHALVQMLPGYYNPHFIGDLGFALGFLVSAHTDLAVHYTTDVDTQTIVDMGPAMGLSHPFFDGALDVGLNIRTLYRVSADDSLSALSFLTGSKLSLKNFGKQGIGIDGDLGAFYHVPWELPFLRISLGASGNNLNKSHYNEFNATVLKGLGSRPTNNDRTLNAGFRLDFPDTWILSAPLVAFELQNVGDTQKRFSLAKRTHIGGETKLTRVLALRAGVNEGYWAAGVGIDLPLVKIDLASYGEELSSNVGNWEDRRYLFRFAFEL